MTHQTDNTDEFIRLKRDEAIKRFDMAKASAGKEMSFSEWFTQTSLNHRTHTLKELREGVEAYRKEMQGLNPFPTEGSSAIDDILSLIDSKLTHLST